MHFQYEILKSKQFKIFYRKKQTVWNIRTRTVSFQTTLLKRVLMLFAFRNALFILIWVLTLAVRTFPSAINGFKHHRGQIFAFALISTRNKTDILPRNVWRTFFHSVMKVCYVPGQRRSQGVCWRGSSTPLSDQNIDVYFLVFHQHCTVNRDQVHCKMFFGSTTGVATHSLSNQAVMNFRDLRNIEAAFFIPACFALPYITRAGCCHALPVWKQAWHLNYQQCRLMCSFYVTKLGPS